MNARPLQFSRGTFVVDAGPDDRTITLPSKDLYNDNDVLGVGVGAGSWWFAPEHYVYLSENLNRGMTVTVDLAGRHGIILSGAQTLIPKFHPHRVPPDNRIGGWPNGEAEVVDQDRSHVYGFNEDYPHSREARFGVQYFNQWWNRHAHRDQDPPNLFTEEGERVTVEYDDEGTTYTYQTWLWATIDFPRTALYNVKTLDDWGDGIDVKRRWSVQLPIEFGFIADDGSVFFGGERTSLYYGGPFFIGFAETAFSPVVCTVNFPDGASYPFYMMYDPSRDSGYVYDDDGLAAMGEVTGSITLDIL